LKDLSGNGNDLHRRGAPLFFADAPADRRLAGEGSALFKGSASYSAQKAIVTSGDRFMLEAWVKPVDDPDNRASAAPRSVAAYGDGGGGYILTQAGPDWVLRVDGRMFTIGRVVPDQWAYIALVKDEAKSGNLYLNGKKMGKFTLAGRIAANFSIGAVDSVESFHGLVYEVRLSAWTGKFDVAGYLGRTVSTAAEAGERVKSSRKQTIDGIAGNKYIKLVDDLVPTSDSRDWLISRIETPVQLLMKKAADGLTARLMLTNGLMSKEFYISGNLACVSMKNLSNGAEYLRAIKPEARVMLDSAWYNVGGLYGQPEMAYLQDAWLKDLVSKPGDFRFSSIEVTTPVIRYPWVRKYNAAPADWPPKGLHVIMHYEMPPSGARAVRGIRVDVHYEMYEGCPVLAKWFTIDNKSGRDIVVDKMEAEVLAVNQDQVSRIQLQSDYSFHCANNRPQASGSTLYPSADNDNPARFGGGTTHWETDPDYNTWATQNAMEDILLKDPHHCLLLSKPLFGPDATVGRDSLFRSFTTFELLYDSDDRERQSLAFRKMYRRLAPQVTESLLSAHITSHDPRQLRSLIDQMAELGFEQLGIDAWPGISHDNLDPSYVSLWKGVADYAKERDIIMGGYELQVASRGRGAEYDCIDPKTGKPGSFFGQSVCIASKWQDLYYPKMWQFVDRTGFMSVNVDGPYHGDVCASIVHPHHHGYYDSQWEQWKFQVKVIHEMQRRNMSTMGWMTLQLVGFYSNDPAIGLEPLSRNIGRYESQLFQYLASGCQLGVRGRRLYDSPETKAMVKKWVDWFRKYRDILTSDIIHVGRPTGRGLDAMLHVNPNLRYKGMLIVFNPTENDKKEKLTVPLYFTGLHGQARIRVEEGSLKDYQLNSRGDAEVPVEVKAGGFTWLVIE
jgi:hypothetical protein